MSNSAKLMLALIVLALAVPVLAAPISELNIVVVPQLRAQTTTMTADDGEIWLVTYVDLGGSGTFNDRREFIDAVLLRPAQR